MASGTSLTRQQIVAGLKALGLPASALLMVHSSLSSLGRVEGGAGTVIEALIEAVGPAGTVLMPTHPARDGRVFDPDTIPSAMGLISETFRRRFGVLRSRHPYHPVAAYGPRAEEMLHGHELSVIPDGPNTPYGRLISQDGWVLLIGCDLDTLTLVHTIEAELDLPYLRELDMSYVDAQGKIQTLSLKRCPGGHRGGVLKFDRLFQTEGAMSVGQIGRSVCRLISAPKAAAIMRREMASDPFFALDDTPHCPDCLRFRGQIKAAKLTGESFSLTTPLCPWDPKLEQKLSLIRGEGISWVEIDGEEREILPAALAALQPRLAGYEVRVSGLRLKMPAPPYMAELVAAAAQLNAAYLHFTVPSRSAVTLPEFVTLVRGLAEIAGKHGLILLLGNQPGSHGETADELARLVEEISSPCVKASYNPAGMVHTSGNPFYNGLYQGRLRRFVRHVDLRDEVARDGQSIRPGQGNGELREIISSLRCRTFDGFFCLWPLPQAGVEGFLAAAQGFWEIMDTI